MAFVAPKTGETRKAYLHRAYGIGKGSGRGRISAEGHAKISEAMAKGHTFPDLENVSTAKAKPVKAEPKGPAKVVIPDDKRKEASGLDPVAIREWAGKNGIVTSKRGRISAETTLAYMEAVPEHERNARENNGKDLRSAAPRVHPEGTEWIARFQYKGEAHSVKVSDRTACGRCRVSLGWCACDRPDVTVGYNDGPVVVSIVRPKGSDA